MKKRFGILTGGGDVPPLNAVISAAAEESSKCGAELLGFLRGWQGLLNKDYIIVNPGDVNPEIGGTILKSSRVNIAKVEDGISRVDSAVKELGLSGLIVIGGDDTTSNSFYIKNIPQVLVSKTIDNDVGMVKENPDGTVDMINYFTLGFPTSADKIASFVSWSEGLRTTAYSHERIMIVESMGLHAGWLTLASAAGKPDFILLPEFNIDYEDLKERIAHKFLEQRNVMVVISEGASWKGGGYISVDENNIDPFGHPRFKGAADVLAEKLRTDLKKYFDTRNVNSVNPSYLYRAGNPNKLDLESGQMLGREAVRKLNHGYTERSFEVIQHNGKEFFADYFEVDRMDSIKDFHRFVNDKLYNPETYNITDEGIRYLSKIVRFREK
jgi:6-phosphofructokinase 1